MFLLLIAVTAFAVAGNNQLDYPGSPYEGTSNHVDAGPLYKHNYMTWN